MYDYAILANGDLKIKLGNQTTILEIGALPDSQVRQDERQQDTKSFGEIPCIYKCFIDCITQHDLEVKTVDTILGSYDLTIKDINLT